MSLSQRIDAVLVDAFAACGLPTDTARAARAARPELADLQCNGAMPLAKATGRNPREIASAVAERLAGRPEIASVEVAGPGFINLRLADGFLSETAAEQDDAPAAGIVQQQGAAPVLLDFGGPNVAKPLHVGHLRALVIGESLRRILGAQNIPTVSDIHLGDWGLQMGMLISEIRHRMPALPCFGTDPALPAGALPLDMDDLQRLYPEAAAASKADPARMAESREATAALQNGDPGARLLWQALRDISLRAQRHDIDRLGAHFDLFLGESDVQALIAPMVAELRGRGIAVESEGALIVEVAEETDAKPMPPLLLAKSDGAALYATTDLATILQRRRDQAPSRILYVVDQRQALHFEQVFRAARRAGYADGIDLVHVGFGTVNGPDGKPYKTREGGVAQLRDLLGDAVDKARERLAANPERLPAGMDDAGLGRLAEQVGLAAVKFADLSSFRTSGYVFDAERLVSFEGRTGPYVQYACVRIASILARGAAQRFEPGPIAVQAPAERALVLDCARLPDVVASATANLAPNEIADYVFALAQSFSRFYNECPVLAADGDAVRASRLSLCRLVHRVLSQGLWLLGIDVPERM
ncbi:arginine--tRNA ligase [Rhizosaccharibacter radicis]|uniref:Arginine--tRNA ligase n=1 Tax=Rhizosaccharibacter radicis TaxID=2782605 RepID=A0ABT1VXS1_9PROT|nr:arginine--tRNA ligase [Acetobacteraceae bacterium KSS12]